MGFLKYHASELMEMSNNQLERSIAAHHVPAEQRNVYKVFMTRARRAAQAGIIEGNIEIRQSGVYILSGCGGPNEQVNLDDF
jgi:hypothetical protein